MRPYHELPGLQCIYLEDSYVIAIVERPAELRFGLEAVLTERHPAWSAPAPCEQYCYRRLDLVFPGVRRITWRARTLTPSRDASGEIDFGNVDAFTWEAGRYDLTGDWGRVGIESDPPVTVDLSRPAG